MHDIVEQSHTTMDRASTKTGEFSPVQQLDEKTVSQIIGKARESDGKIREEIAKVMPTIPSAELKTKLSQEMSAIDEQNIRVLEDLYQRGLIQTADQCEEAAFIFQHSLDPRHTLVAFELSHRAAVKGQLPERTLLAQSFDRYMQRMQELNGVPKSEIRQRFGMQMYIDENNASHTYTSDNQATPIQRHILGLDNQQDGSFADRWRSMTDNEREKELEPIKADFKALQTLFEKQ